MVAVMMLEGAGVLLIVDRIIKQHERLQLEYFWSQVNICALLQFLHLMGYSPHYCGQSFELVVPCDECGAGL